MKIVDTRQVEAFKIAQLRYENLYKRPAPLAFPYKFNKDK